MGGVLMPLYEYKCSKCGHKFEGIVSVGSRDDSVVCPKCGSNTKRLLGNIATFRIKGDR